MGNALPMPPKFGPPKKKSPAAPPGFGNSVGSGGGGGGGTGAKANPGAKPAKTVKVAGPPAPPQVHGGAEFIKNLVNTFGDLYNPIVDAIDAGMSGDTPSGGGGGGSGGSRRRRSGGGGGGGGGVAAAPEIPAFTDPYANLRASLQGIYNGNGVNDPGIQAYLQKLTADTAGRVQGYSHDAAAQSQVAGQAIQANLAQSEAARKAAVAAQMNDLIAQGGGAQAGRLAAVGAQGQAQLAGQSAGAATTTSRMADIFNQQSADRLAGVQNTGQFAEGQAAANYAKMLATVDSQTAQAKAAYDQMVAGIKAGGSGGGGGGGRGFGGGGGGSSKSSDGFYQDTNTRTLTDNQTQTMTDEDMATQAQAEIWNSMSASDKAAVQAIQTYAVFPELAQAQGVDLKKISQTNPAAFNYWMQVQGNNFGYPYSKSTSTNNNQQYNRDSSVRTSKYTSPKSYGPPPPTGPSGIKHIPRF